MGRKLKKEEEKKINLSISLDKENIDTLIKLKINKSKFVNYLLVEYFNSKIS